MAVQIRHSSSQSNQPANQPTNQPTNLSLKSFIATSPEPQESSDLAQEQAFVAPMMGYLEERLQSVWQSEHLLMKYFPMSGPQASFLL